MTKTYTCRDCGASYDNRNSYNGHRTRKHPTGGRVVCCIITKKLLTLAQFEANGKRTKNCVCCGRLFVGDGAAAKFCSRSCGAVVNNKSKTGPRTFSEKWKRQAMSVLKANLERGFQKICVTCKSDFVAGSVAARYCSKACRPSTRSGRPVGGCRDRSGRSKYGYFEGIWCQSTYEMAFVWKCLSEGKSIARNTEGFPYLNDKGQDRMFYPDFLVDGQYYEVKGWMTENVQRKISAFPHDIILLIGDDILNIVKAAQQHFGTKDLASVYAENSRPIKLSTCETCTSVFGVKPGRTGRFCSLPCSGRGRAKQKVVDRRRIELRFPR